MGRQLTEEEWHDLFERYNYTARRLEPRDTYSTSDAGVQRRKAYLAGQLTDYSWMDNWVSDVRRWTSQGKSVHRVRVVTEPLSDDARYLLHVGRINVAAGDNIRYLPRHRARELNLGLPAEDYWIFDANKIAVIHFNDDDRPVGYELMENPAEIVPRMHWFDAAWHHSVPRDEFAAKHGIDPAPLPE